MDVQCFCFCETLAMYHWLKTESFKKKENTNQNELHDNKETDTVGIKDELQEKHDMMAISN
jgi:hypothetical protein